MKMLMFLLVSTVAVLVSSMSIHLQNTSRNRIIDIINAYNRTLNKEMYVETVEHLYKSNKRCPDAFFCKVHDILVKHKNASENEQDDSLMRNLKQVVDKINCEEKLKTVTPASGKILFIDFLDYFKRCIQCRNTKPNEPHC